MDNIKKELSNCITKKKNLVTFSMLRRCEIITLKILKHLYKHLICFES